MKNENTAVVICAVNSKYIHSSLAPWCLLAGIRRYCTGEISVKVVEGTINEQTEETVLRIAAYSPQIVGLSCYIWNISVIKKLVPMLKERMPNAVIILGGAEVSYNAAEVLKENPLVDYVISGEGEKPFALLTDALINEKSVVGIDGVSYRRNGEIIEGIPYISDEEPPDPYTEEYFSSLNGRIAYLETSRGCPYSCAFCLSGRCGNVRFFDIERAKREILLLANSGAKTVKLVDRTFNANRMRARELISFIISEFGKEIPKGVCFHFEIAGDILDSETINLLAQAPIGAIQLEIGMQSFNGYTLESINRKTDVDKLKENIVSVVENSNMHIHIDLIAGLPYEDFSSFAKSFDTAYELGANMLQLGFLKLLHGAPMREQPEKYPCSYSDEPPYEVIETPWISKAELEVIRNAEDALDRLYNSGRFRRTLKYVLSASGSTAFKLFCDFGNFAAGKKLDKITLDDYTAIVFEYFGMYRGVDKNVLRDIMVCDRLATVSTGLLPTVLKIRDDKLKKIRLALDRNSQTMRKKGIRRGLEMLYTENCAVYADYDVKNPITGEYEIKKIIRDTLINCGAVDYLPRKFCTEGQDNQY